MFYAREMGDCCKAASKQFPVILSCGYLTEWSSPETLEAGAMSGAILETYIFAEILKSWWNRGRQPPVYYYRDKDGKEIDLLLVGD